MRGVPEGDRAGEGRGRPHDDENIVVDNGRQREHIERLVDRLVAVLPPLTEPRLAGSAHGS